MREKNISVEDAISWMTVATVACYILESVGHAATMFVATPIIMDSHSITVGINFREWENFMTAKCDL